MKPWILFTLPPLPLFFTVRSLAVQKTHKGHSQVDVDNQMATIYGESALVYQGILHQNEVARQVAIKMFRSGPLENLDTLKVMMGRSPMMVLIP